MSADSAPKTPRRASPCTWLSFIVPALMFGAGVLVNDKFREGFGGAIFFYLVGFIGAPIVALVLMGCAVVRRERWEPGCLLWVLVAFALFALKALLWR